MCLHVRSTSHAAVTTLHVRRAASQWILPLCTTVSRCGFKETTACVNEIVLRVPRIYAEYRVITTVMVFYLVLLRGFGRCVSQPSHLELAAQFLHRAPERHLDLQHRAFEPVLVSQTHFLQHRACSVTRSDCSLFHRHRHQVFPVLE
jgi:hypothetical protein